MPSPRGGVREEGRAPTQPSYARSGGNLRKFLLDDGPRVWRLVAACETLEPVAGDCTQVVGVCVWGGGCGVESGIAGVCV